MKLTSTTRVIGAVFAGFLALTPAHAFDLANMTDAERAQFGAEVRTYLLENPEVIFEAAEIYRAREAELAEASAAQAMIDMRSDLVDDGISYVGGNVDGDVTIVEFVDYRCGYCRKAHDEVQALVKEDGNIRLVIKEFPILSEASDISARVAMATKIAFGPDAYALVHDLLMALNGPMNEAAVTSIAKEVGLDSDILLAAMEDPTISEYLDMVRLQAEALDINGTPAFIIGDDIARGYIPQSAMIEAIEVARANQ